MQRLKKYTGIVQHIDENDSIVIISSPSILRHASFLSKVCGVAAIIVRKRNVMVSSRYHENMTLEGGLSGNRVDRFHLLVCGDIPFELSLMMII